MAAIIGAFFAGLAFADYSPEWNLEPRAQAINQFLSPFFFFTMGSRLDLSVFSRSIVLLALGLSAIAVVSKVVACGLPLYREGWRNMLKVGVGMTPRGEVALIVALMGYPSTATLAQAAWFLQRSFSIGTSWRTK
jgi:Kef-type K+ transport system membrane component KefB